MYDWKSYWCEVKEDLHMSDENREEYQAKIESLDRRGSGQAVVWRENEKEIRRN